MPETSDPKGLLQKRIGYNFSDTALLDRALTHRSVSQTHMERLEFLGDSVLGLVISEYLHHKFPEEDEGNLSRMRASVVRREGLLKVAESWDLFSCLNVGEGERHGRGVKSVSIAANAVEAIIGAVFSDGGWLVARQVVLQAWEPLLRMMGRGDLRDAKSRLQELTQSEGWGLPTYQVTDLGAGQTPRFQARCRVRDKQMGMGTGARKKNAEINAAEQALERLKSEAGKGI